MTHHPANRLFLPPDPQAPQRLARLRDLGLGQRPEPQFDAFAKQVAGEAGTPLAMVNFVREKDQYFAGLHAPGLVEGSVALPDDPARFMTLEQGYCPIVVQHRKARVLGDVHAYPRFKGNPVVDQFGIRAYMGAPLIDDAGIVLGTVCAVDTVQRDWENDETLNFIKTQAARMMTIIHGRRPATGR